MVDSSVFSSLSRFSGLLPFSLCFCWLQLPLASSPSNLSSGNANDAYHIGAVAGSVLSCLFALTDPNIPELLSDKLNHLNDSLTDAQGCSSPRLSPSPSITIHTRQFYGAKAILNSFVFRGRIDRSSGFFHPTGVKIFASISVRTSHTCVNK